MKSIFCTQVLLLSLISSVMGQFLTPVEQKYISENFISLDVDENYQNGNWDPVLKAIGNKRIVMLGEVNHGSSEIFSTRNDLVRELHKRLGFEVILFESGLGEMETLNLNKDNLSPRQLTAGFFGIWRTQEFEELMGYIKENNIQISGFDVQRSGHTFTNYLSENIDENENFLDAEKTFMELKSQLSKWSTDFDSVRGPTMELITTYEGIRNEIRIQDGFSHKAIDNRINYLNYMLEFTRSKDYNARWEKRDLTMANNVKWILSKIHPDQKVIIFGHNFHISRYNEKENVMGEFLKEAYSDEMYVLGTFIGGGTYANNAGEPRELSPPDDQELDIKHVISSDQARMTFYNIPVNIPKQAQWIRESIIVNDTFIDLSSSNKLIISKWFDGILLLDSVTLPKKPDR